MRSTPRYSLKRKLLRMSWNKHNLYNLSTKKLPSIQGRTLYQQKWAAKKETRAYHGDSLTETKFSAGFDPNLKGVIGRLTGGNKGEIKTSQKPRPLASQTFAFLEKRLDVVIFRSLFASSVHQARQLVIHGKVKVNGEKLVHPSYSLKSGDMYQVDPEMVRKSISDYHEVDSLSRKKIESNEDKTDPNSTLAQGQEVEQAKEAKTQEGEEAEKLEKIDEENTVIKAGEDSRQGENKTATTESGQPTKPLSKYRQKKLEKESIEKFHPKSYMAPFAFIPSYLEVSHLTCTGIYLQDPVARPGLVEVPSPFPPALHTLVHSFYIRGRR